MLPLIFTVIHPLQLLLTSFLPWVTRSRSSLASLSSPSHLSPPLYSLTSRYDERISSLFVTSALSVSFLTHLQSQAVSLHSFVFITSVLPLSALLPILSFIFATLPILTCWSITSLWKWIDNESRSGRRDCLGYNSDPNSILRWNFKIEWHLLSISMDQYLFSSITCLTYTWKLSPGWMDFQPWFASVSFLSTGFTYLYLNFLRFIV